MRAIRWRMLCCVLTLASLSGTLFGLGDDRVALRLDTSEADQALAILRKQAGHRAITRGDWKALFDTVPYQWLKAREAAMGRSFTDEDFERFLLSPAASASEGQWSQTLAEMKRSDMAALGTRVLAWLPGGATIDARVFPEIKPKMNSFVWTKKESGPAIFLYLERESRAKFENTVMHECHHIGLDSLSARQDKMQAGLPEKVKLAMRWMGAFGEGEAMLAAAGDDARHPHWEDGALDRARWDGDLMHFNTDVLALQQFFLAILDGTLKDDAAIGKRAAPFWGDVQGAWYTVGYEMAVLVDAHDGREALNDCLLDPRKLLARYNAIAREASGEGATLATWSPELLSRLDGVAAR